MSIEAMKQALEALEGWANHGNWVWPESALEQAKRNTVEAMTALRTAIEQAERDWSLLEATQESLREHMAEIKRLKQRQWVGLTDEEVEQLAAQVWFGGASAGHERFAKLIEAKLKEKNETT